MAVAEDVVVEARRYSGWVDPRFPIGYWMAALTVTGDGTGGSLSVGLVFQGAVPAFLNSQMYSVERFAIRTSDSTSRIVRVTATNMGGPSGQTGLEHQYTVDVDGQAILGGAVRTESLAFLPWFLGSQRNAGTTASLSLIATNTSGVNFQFEAEGYRWSARSVLVDGGPQRPPTGPYGQ